MHGLVYPEECLRRLVNQKQTFDVAYTLERLLGERSREFYWTETFRKKAVREYIEYASHQHVYKALLEEKNTDRNCKSIRTTGREG